MSHLTSNLHDGDKAKVQVASKVYNNNKQPLNDLAAGTIVTVVGQPEITSQEIWWRVRGNNGVAFTVEYRNGTRYLVPATPGSSPETGFFWYTIEPGDSWSKIASKYDTSVARLMDMNEELRRPGDLLQPGDRMRVPGNP